MKSEAGPVHRFGALFIAGLLLIAGCAQARQVPPAPLPPEPAPPPVAMTLQRSSPEAVGMSPRLDERLDSIMTAAVSGGVAPGAALAVGRHGRLVCGVLSRRSDADFQREPVRCR